MIVSKLALATIAIYASTGLALPFTNSTQINHRSCWFACLVCEPVCPTGWHQEKLNDVKYPGSCWSIVRSVFL
ncbi:hypothetical protein BDV28DRAFT_148014 [Aspergillus coremiiformis]|uniref:4Fe-4S ferredoxin-type domain-containing protein n=1 Tax=Aspergillus coremiiformis TaxID=138285 RepID=A0A5N6Z775_9EURO|nr:hypothetical protein BDV28DRAFT_148014 [Aspergillus coremiiformis]